MLSPQAQAVKANKGVKIKPVKPVPSPQGLGLSQSDITKAIKENLRPQVQQMAAGGATRGQVSAAIRSGNFPTTTPTATPTTTTTVFKPDANWWNAQFQDDHRWLAQNPALTTAEEGTAARYGYRINKINGQTAYKSSSTGASGITQVLDANGVPVLDEKGGMQYKDATGKLYAPGDLVLDIVKIKPGEEGYLQGEIGATTAQSAVQQQNLAEQAAQAGARRSGMRETGRSLEAAALSRALDNVFGSATGAFADIAGQRRGLVSDIYKTLLDRAGSTPGTTVEVPGTPTPPAYTPGPTTVGGVTVPKKPLPQAQSFNVAGQSVTLPKGIDLTGVDVRGIGDRVANNVRTAGGVGKLKSNQVVGQFRAGGKGYVVRYKGGRFVIEAAG